MAPGGSYSRGTRGQSPMFDMEKIANMAQHAIRTLGRLAPTLALATVAAMGVAAVSDTASAQKAKKAKPKSNWIKVCDKIKVPVLGKDKKPVRKDATVCNTFHEQVNPFGFVRVAIQKMDFVKPDKNTPPQGERLQIQVPQGMRLRYGIRVAPATAKECDALGKTLVQAVRKKGKFPFVEKAVKAKASVLPYRSCGGDGRRTPLSCYAQVPASKKMIASIRKASCLAVQTFSEIRVPPVWLVRMKGFDKAYGGKPITGKDYRSFLVKRNKLILQAQKKRRDAALAKDPKLRAKVKKLEEAQKALAKELREKRAKAAKAKKEKK